VHDIFLRAHVVVTDRSKEPPAKYPYLAEKQVGKHATATILDAQPAKTSDFNGIVLTLKLRSKKYSYPLSFANRPDIKAICAQLKSTESDDWIGKQISFTTEKENRRNRGATTVSVFRPGRRKGAHHSEDPKWPEHALVFDTETRITADQSLTFGVYRRCELMGDRYSVKEEGIFYADDLPAKERRVLESYVQTEDPDETSFPPQYPLYSRYQFMHKVFWPAIKRDGALICGLNLPFDLARLALDWDRGEHNEWSLTMSQFSDGTENKRRPRILIQPIDSKKAFIRLARPWTPKEWKNGGKAHFLDLRTLAWALFNQSFSLKRLCEELKTEHQKKKDHEPTGKVTLNEIEYARQDGRCTVDALNRLKQEFDEHPISLKPHNAYSPASVAKSYLEAMKIVRPGEKFKIYPKELGIAMQSYYGGRSETRIT